MRKIYTLLSAMALTAMAATAQTLPDGTVTSGLSGGYMCSEWGVSDLDVQYLSNGVAQTIEFVSGAESVNLTLTVPGTDATPLTVQAVVQAANQGIMSGTRADDDVTYLRIKLTNLDYTWPAGKYSVEIPAGTVKNSAGDENAAQTISWTMVNEYAYILDSQIDPQPAAPDEGIPGIYNPDELEEVTFTFSEKITLLGGSSITYSTGNDDEMVLDSKYVSTEENELILDLSFLTEGTYIFNIPSGYLLVGTDKLFGGKSSITYIVWDGLPAGEILSGPAPIGVYVNNIEIYYGQSIEAVGEFPEIGVYEGWYSEGETPAFTIPASNVSIQTISYGDGEGAEPADDATTGEGDTEEIDVLYIDIIEAFMGKTGEYIIVIPAGIVKNSDGDENPQRTISFRLVEIMEEDPSIAIEEGVLTMVWADATYVSNNEGINAYIESGNAKTVLSVYDWTNPDGEVEITGTGIEINLDEVIDQDGDYTLVIPEAFLNIETEEGDYINNEIIYTFTYEGGEYSGVKSLQSESVKGVEGIFDLQGRKINNPTKGLYIINGKKVVVK